MDKFNTDIGRLWIYVRDDLSFAGRAPPAAIFHYSRDQRGEHAKAHFASWSGVLQADAYSGFGDLYVAGRQPGLVLEASCWAHGRHKVFEFADIETARIKQARDEKPKPVYPLALEAVRRIDALFDIERDINGLPPKQRSAIRQARSAPIMAELETWITETRDKFSRGHDLAKALNDTLRRQPSFTCFLQDGRICLTNNAAERALRGVVLGRKAWLLCGSDRGGQRAAILYSLIVTANMNDVDPQAWLADVLARIAGHPVQQLDELLQWSWKPRAAAPEAAAA